MSEKGYTLIELLVTMIILSIVVAGLTTIFVSGSNAEAQLNNRFQAQLQARTALDKLRLDIHCALCGAGADGQHVSEREARGRQLLCRDTDDLVVCRAGARRRRRAISSIARRAPRTFASLLTRAACSIADYLTSSSVFTTATVPQYSLQTVGVSLTVSTNQKSKTAEVYKLSDSIVARASTRCVTSGGCAAPTVP